MSQFVLFAPEGEGLTVGPVDYQLANDLIARKHYLGRPGSTSEAFGLFSGLEIIGAITFGTIMRKNAAAICGDVWADRVMELTRLWVSDDFGVNTESRFIGRSIKLLRDLRPQTAILLSYADSEHGHVGTIYQATNWLYTGYSTKGSFIDDEGERIHARTLRDSRRGATVETTGSYKWKASLPKHRYVMFLGSQSQKKQLRNAFRWEVLPYPKKTLCVMCEEVTHDATAGAYCGECTAYYGSLLPASAALGEDA